MILKQNIFISLLLTAFHVSAFQNDTTKLLYNASEINYINENDLARGDYKFQSVDTSVYNLSCYNTVHKQLFDYKFLGNTGTAHQRIVFNPISASGFDFGYHQFDLYKFDFSDAKFYNAKTRYSELGFTAGMIKEQNLLKEQMLTIQHTQNINANLNFGLNYRRLAAPGFNYYQKTDYHNLLTHVWYQSTNKRYNLALSGVLNNIKVQENGGVKNNNIFTDTLVRERYIELVNLNNAEIRSKDKGVGVNQYFDFGNYHQITLNDTDTTRVFLPTNRIFHIVKLQKGYYVFSDKDAAINDSVYYPEIYFLAGSNPLDSIGFSKYRNSFGWTLVPVKWNESMACNVSANRRVSIFGTLENWELSIPFMTNNAGVKTVSRFSYKMQNFSVNGIFEQKFKTHWSLTISGDYFFEGYNKEDSKKELVLKRDKPTSLMEFTLTNQIRTPDLVKTRYVYNFMNWEEKYVKEEFSKMELKYQNKNAGFLLGTTAFLLNNYIYFDETVQPVQYNGELVVIQGYIDKSTNIKKFHLNNSLVYQYTESNIVNIPKIFIKNKFYYEDSWFKKAILVQIGVNINYFSGYFSDTYMPANGQFYRQQELKIGNHPYADLFIHAKIKRARLFFKIENANMGFPSNGYFQVPYYPMPDRRGVLGIIWKFFD